MTMRQKPVFETAGRTLTSVSCFEQPEHEKLKKYTRYRIILLDANHAPQTTCVHKQGTVRPLVAGQFQVEYAVAEGETVPLEELEEYE